MDRSQTLNFKLVDNSFVEISTKFSPYRNIVQLDRPRASIIFNWREKWHSSSDIPDIHSLTLWWVRNLLAKWTFVLYSVPFPTNGKWWGEKCLNVRQSVRRLLFLSRGNYVDLSKPWTRDWRLLPGNSAFCSVFKSHRQMYVLKKRSFPLCDKIFITARS